MWCSVNFIILAFIFLRRNVSCNSRVDPLVSTKLGLIKGLTAEDGDYSMFLGIPYGEVDHNNPFGLSKPYPKFEEPFEAYYDTAICPQKEGFNNTIIGEMECLVLHIYVPNTANSHNLLPVMINIHGGFFRRGISGRFQFGPKYLVRHDVVLVSLSYRLGPYGFMCLDIPEVPGNQGLKDQALALRWIKDNIEAFGGNPSEMTVFGLSAGGHSIDFHLMFGDEDIFKKAILQSGSSLASTVFTNQDKEAPLTLAKHFGFITESVYEAISYLSTLSTDAVITAVIDLGVDYKPCVEKSFDGIVPFIDQNWVKSVSRNFKDKTIIFGFAENEKILDYIDPTAYVGVDVFYDKLKAIFNFEEKKLVEMKSFVQSFYLGDQMINETSQMALANFDSDFTYIHPIQRIIARYLENKAKTIYYYMFSYKGGRNNMQIINHVSIDGVSHADELGYLFDSVFIADEPTEQDQLMIDRMTTLFTNFAKFGDPTPETTDMLPVKWEPLTKETYNYLHINAKMSLKSRPMHQNMAFWDLFYAINEKHQKAYDEP